MKKKWHELIQCVGMYTHVQGNKIWMVSDFIAKRFDPYTLKIDMEITFHEPTFLHFDERFFTFLFVSDHQVVDIVNFFFPNKKMEFLLTKWLPQCLLPTIVSYLDFHGICVREIESDVTIDKLWPLSNGDLLRYSRYRKMSRWDQNQWIELCSVPPSTSFRIQNDKVWFISERSIKRYDPYTLHEDKPIYMERIRDVIVLDESRLLVTHYNQFTLIDGETVNVVNSEMPSYGNYLLLDDYLLAHIYRRDSIISIWNYKTGVLVRNVEDHDTNVDSIDLLSPDEMISQGRKTVKIWNLKTWQCTKTIPMQDVARPILAVSHHQFLTRYNNKMRLWDSLSSTSRLLLDGKFCFIQKQNDRVVTYAGQTIQIWK